MASEMAEAIRQLTQEKGISEESVKMTIENMLKAAYKRTYGTAENAIVKFADDLSDVSIYSRKTIVDGVYDPVTEMELEEALKLSPDCEVGDEIDILEYKQDKFNISYQQFEYQEDIQRDSSSTSEISSIEYYYLHNE